MKELSLVPTTGRVWRLKSGFAVIIPTKGLSPRRTELILHIPTLGISISGDGTIHRIMLTAIKDAIMQQP